MLSLLDQPLKPLLVQYLRPQLLGPRQLRAGLRPDDLIVYIDGELVPSIKIFRDIMKQVGPGTEVKLDIQRVNKLLSVKMKLGEQPKLKTAK